MYTAWRPYRKKDIDTLEHIQRRAKKIIPELERRGDQIEVFNILYGYKNIDRNMFFSRKIVELEDMR